MRSNIHIYNMYCRTQKLLGDWFITLQACKYVGCKDYDLWNAVRSNSIKPPIKMHPRLVIWPRDQLDALRRLRRGR